MRRVTWLLMSLFAAAVSAQGIEGVDINASKQQLVGQNVQPAGALPSASNRASTSSNSAKRPMDEAQTREARIQALRTREVGPPRFGADLFEVHQSASFASDGGVPDDYVLGPGDQLYLNATGSANFDFTSAVDGTGSVAIPKVGNARVAGRSLGDAKAAIQRLVEQKFSRTRVDLQVVQLRDIRVSILGEVYLPGSYLAPSLASLVNVLSLAGGPTAAGSYRDVRVMRGGRAVYHLDLYPLRADGLGNPDFALQSGDVVFVPLATEPVRAEGAFSRVARMRQEPDASDTDLLSTKPEDEKQAALTREYQAVRAQLDPDQAQPVVRMETSAAPTLTVIPGGGEGRKPRPPVQVLDPARRLELEDRLAYLRNQILDLVSQRRSDHRLEVDPITKLPRAPQAETDEPEWRRRWELSGKPPVMAFEMKSGETLADLLRYAGGLAPEAGLGPISVRSRDAAGRFEVTSVDLGKGEEARVGLYPGDVVSASLARATSDQQVRVEGWARVPGAFARTEGLRVGDLLKRESQTLPDTYLHRGEIVRTLPDGTSQLFSFDVTKAMEGDASQNPLLADRDRIELYRMGDLRLQRTVALLGPVARPGVYAFHEGMRAADLIFQGGVPRKNADRLAAELARTLDGKASQIRRLDLASLLSTEAASPVALTDEAVNPLLQPDDQLSLFEKPGYKVHRTVLLQGEVAHPGSYVLDEEHETLSQLLARAGGLTKNAMPGGGIFLRQIGQADAPSALASALASNQPGGAAPSSFTGRVESDATAAAQDPASNGANDVLSRLNETKRNPLNGQLLASPLLHGLTAGELNRLVVDFRGALKGDKKADVELLDGDTIIIPKKMDVAYVVGEAASPFAAYKVEKGLTARDLLKLAGGPTRNADTWNIRLLKADGRIVDSWVMRKGIEPGDTLLVPQRIRRDTTWQENLQALTPIAILLNTLK